MLLAAALALTLALDDLAEVYPAALDHEEGFPAHDWESGPEDVWSLTSFRFAHGDDLAVELGRSTVVFGRNDTSVLWAVVLPAEPAPLVASEAAGGGAAIRSVFLRFNPSLVAELFPSETVVGRGEARSALEAKRVFHWKIGGSWQSGNRPVVPWRHSIVVDVATDGPRRFFMIDTNEGTVKYEPAFANRRLPDAVPLTAEEALAAFDEAWSAFDREYAGFGLLPDVDWAALRDRWRPVAAEAATAYEVAAAIGGLLEPLDDFHAWVAAGDEFIPLQRRSRFRAASWPGSVAQIGEVRDTRKQVASGRTEDGVGYVNVYGLGHPELTETFDAALEELADTWALVLDLRFNGGGDELRARSLAGRFLAEPVVYSKNRYRDGPAHDDLGPVLDRTCEPRGPWRYAAPIVVLQNGTTMSSAESFLLMLAQAPEARTMGQATAGSSGNPRRLELAGGIRVNLPRWLDLDPDGAPIEHVGIAPDLPVDADPAEYTNEADPVVVEALRRLREIPEDERRPAKR